MENLWKGYLKNSFVYTSIVLLFIVILLLAKLVEVQFIVYLFILVFFGAGLTVLLRYKSRKGWKKFVLFLLIGLFSLLTIVCFRTNSEVSFYGNLMNNTIKTVNHVYERKHGESFVVAKMKKDTESYQFGSWSAPKGYQNKKIELKQAKGYLLSKLGSKHQKVVYQIHGGGYIGGFSNTYNETAVNYSKSSGDSDVFSLDYRTAPKSLYPAALEDALEGYQWLLEHGYQAKNIRIAGDSAGAGLTLALTLYLRDHQIVLPKSLILVSPWADLTASGTSYKTKILSDPLFGSYSVQTAPKYPVPITYAGHHDLKDPYLSPVFGEYTNFPPMLIQTGANELLLSDSQTVVKKVQKVGGVVKFIEYPGMYHIFYITSPKLQESQNAWEMIQTFIKQY
ncbi:alpha/beta hydrolase [Vagococcus entomophilus]|uniref:Alpha/beta hydrolase n=2 Tax=Vagococcus entomophilus TaxID=1160095 RepID=A0A430AFA2_9ENTE|nr:alpha/beta hydrolase [Vagococcus entomophilus]